MKLRSTPIVGCMTLAMSLFLADLKIDCKDVAAAGLMDAMWFGAAVAVNQQANNTATAGAQAEQDVPPVPGPQGEQGVPGDPGTAGADGISCWDLNANGIGDLEEDINADGQYNALDCQGAAGANGADGANGTDGVDGEDGKDGKDGVDGEDGQDGTDGTDGVDGKDGKDGVDGDNGENGANGLSCWDLNGNGVGDPAEDLNDDGNFDALDCQGADGADGADLTGVIARGVILANATIESGEAITSVTLEQPGSYLVSVSLAEVDQLPASANDFPVLLSIQAIYSQPGGGEIGLLVAHYETVSMTTDTLTVRVIVRDLQSGVWVNADFSILVLEP
ncbi:MAG: hypothetical protein KKB50_12295 [Planctomycetes bacterium]|nr:hypothetical protein [Planctomycetota bacterium]